MSGTPQGVAGRLVAVRERIAAAARRAGRAPGEITLVGVAKGQPVSAIAEALHAGLRDVGESYAQEARRKLPELRAKLEGSGLEWPRWHFVGRLQRNKVAALMPDFDVVHSLDRAALGEALERGAARVGRRLAVFAQVDVSGEPAKGGVALEALPEILEASTAWAHLDVVGLMAIPAAGGGPEAARPAFARLRRLRDDLSRAPGGAGLRELSMGMSGDFEVAIEEGATQVRLGTAIFGPRTPRGRGA